MKKIYIFLLSITALVPLGLLTENPAWGEWESEKYKEMLGFIPKGIENSFSFKSLFSDYSTPFFGAVGSYYFSAVIGIGLIFLVFLILKRVINR